VVGQLESKSEWKKKLKFEMNKYNNNNNNSVYSLRQYVYLIKGKWRPSDVYVYNKGISVWYTVGCICT